MISAIARPAASVPVFRAADLVVEHGVNAGDELSFAAELIPAGAEEIAIEHHGEASGERAESKEDHEDTEQTSSERSSILRQGRGGRLILGSHR